MSHRRPRTPRPASLAVIAHHNRHSRITYADLKASLHTAKVRAEAIEAAMEMRRRGPRVVEESAVFDAA
jgi:hypothetical protein